MNTEIDMIKSEIKDREELANSAIQSKENTIEKLNVLKKLINDKYKDKEKTDILIKQLFSLYFYCQISDKTINTKDKLAKFVNNYEMNEQEYEYSEYNDLYGCEGLKEYNPFKEYLSKYTKELKKLFAKLNMHEKEICLEYFYFNENYHCDSYDNYFYDNAYYEGGLHSPYSVRFVKVLCKDDNLLKDEIYSYEKIMELILSGKIVVIETFVKDKEELPSRIEEKLKDADLYDVDIDKMIENIDKYSLCEYIDYIQSFKKRDGATGELVRLFDSVCGGIWDINKSKKSNLAKIFPQVNQFAFDFLVQMIDKQIVNQNKDLLEIKQEYSKFLKDMTKKIKSEQEKDKKNNVNNLGKER